MQSIAVPVRQRQERPGGRAARWQRSTSSWPTCRPAIFFLAAAFGVVAIIAVLSISERAIDHRAARGLEHDHAAPDDPGTGDGQAEGFRELLRNKPLLILAAALACLHLGNGAMLALYGLAVVGMGKGDPAMFTATTVMVAQAVMTVQGVHASLSPAIGGWLAQMLGYHATFLILGGFALVSLGLWIGFAATLRPACATGASRP